MRQQRGKNSADRSEGLLKANAIRRYELNAPSSAQSELARPYPHPVAMNRV